MYLHPNYLLIIHVAALLCGSGQGQAPTPRYSTKTGYETSFESGTSEGAQRSRHWMTLAREVGEFAVVDRCRPVGLYVVYRHGTRYASDGDIEDYDAILSRIKTDGLNDRFSDLRNITDNMYPLSREGQLHLAGYTEMENLALRLKLRLPELFDGKGLEKFSFQSTYKQRTIDSAKGFIKGLLGLNVTCNSTHKAAHQDTVTCENPTSDDVEDREVVVINHNKEGSDTLLRFYESCTKFINSVDENDTAIIEHTKFAESPELTEVFNAVAAKLSPVGVPTPFKMTMDDLEVMHHMCGYETAYFGVSPWCNIFTDEEKRVVEYWLDLKQYWKEGYGHEINYKMACPLVDDVVRYMGAAKSKGITKGSFKFAHSSTLQPLLTILGLYRDSPTLMADNYNVSINRAWASGRISPMAGNIAFNVFQCPTGGHRVLVLHNELPIKLGSCEEYFCAYDDVASHLKESSDGCEWNTICGTSSANYMSPTETLIMLFLYLSAPLLTS